MQVSQAPLPHPVFSAEEAEDYRKTIQEALTVLGKKHLTLILHGPSFPSVVGEDTGIGSPFGQAAQDLIQFMQGHGFNSLQLGPGGKTKSVDASPYVGTNFSDNPLFIDLADLVRNPAWHGILSEETFQRIIKNNPKPWPDAEHPNSQHWMAYDYIYGAQDEALQEAFQNYQSKPEIQEALKGRFEAYKEKNASWLERDALYEALSTIHGNDYWPHWPVELDKRLFCPTNRQEESAALQRIDELKTNHAALLEAYAFKQFISHTQKEVMKSFVLDRNFQLIADRQVAFSDRDIWAYQALFLPGYFMGCPPDHFSQFGQAWGFPILDPVKIFKADGTLAEGGQLLKGIFEKAFSENPGGVRIDHIVGLIDPWVYLHDARPMPEDGAGRLYSSPDHPVLNVYSRIHHENLDMSIPPDDERRVAYVNEDQVARYAEIINIVVQAAHNNNLGIESVICEDLGTLTAPVKSVMAKLGLGGMRVTQFTNPHDRTDRYRGLNLAPNYWVMVGSHDNDPLYRWTHEQFLHGQPENHARQLSDDLLPPDAEAHRREELFAFILAHPKNMLAVKFAELFSCPAEHVQIFFSDFFGIDALYNRPSTSGHTNWCLRLPNDYAEYYARSLKQCVAVNMPEVLRIAIHARNLQETHHELLNRLAHFETVLKSLHPEEILENV